MPKANNGQDPGEFWRELLTEGHRPLAVLQWTFRHMPSPPRCKLCYNPFGGVGGRIVGVAGFKPSRKNPNFCVRCCEALPIGGADVDIAVLFVDVRNSVRMASGTSPKTFAATLNRFYSEATGALVAHDAIIDKLVGDEVMALFIPGIAGKHYRRRAVDAAESLLQRVGYRRNGEPWIEIGIAVHAGEAYVGNVGSSAVVDFTALGDTVNVAARLQAVAKPGELVLSEELWQSIGAPAGGEPREYDLKGKDERVPARVFHPALG
ncbi:MAG: adenylate/guanylate cyclase domain-containing protein [Dehalococcoidia bacterium]|nr:adenylate/guanylate cyclase domain-containing protein [Dehalococcoidia bacterium]